MKRRNSKTLFRKILFLATVFMPALSMQAQVTIGSSEPPLNTSLLDIKSITGVIDGSEDATKGVAFPRVKLAQKDRLYPMYTNTSPEYDTTAEIIAEGKKSTGLIVYNTFESLPTETNPLYIFKKGLYVWVGTEWRGVGSADVKNGISIDGIDGKIKLGGAMTENTTITADAKNIIFKMENTGSTREDGFIIDGLEVQTANSYPVVIDVETGKLGMVKTASDVNFAFLQSDKETVLGTVAGPVTPGMTNDINRLR